MREAPAGAKLVAAMTSLHAPGAPDAAEGMVWIRGGTFRMGSDEFYPEEQPVRDVSVDGFWIEPHPVTVAEFTRFVKATGLCHARRACPRPRRLPGRRPVAARARLAGLRAATRGPVDLDDQRTGGNTSPARTGATRKGPTPTLHGACAPPRHARRLRGRARLRRMGGPRAPHRGRVGVRRARRPRRRPLPVGRRRVPGRTGRGQHLAGRIPVAEPPDRRLRPNVARGAPSSPTATGCTT